MAVTNVVGVGPEFAAQQFRIPLSARAALQASAVPMEVLPAGTNPGDVLTWNGTEWVSTAPATGGLPGYFVIDDFGASPAALPAVNSAAIEAAAAAASAAAGGIVYVPPGLYQITTLTIDEADVALTGIAGSVLETSITGSDIVTVTGARSGLQGGTIRTVGGATPSSQVRLVGDNAFCLGVELDNHFIGLTLEGVNQRAQNNWIHDQVVDGINLSGDGSLVFGNLIHSCGGVGIELFVGAASACLVQHNRIVANGGAGIDVGGTDHVVVANGIRGNGGAALEVQSTALRLVVARNNYDANVGGDVTFVPVRTIAAGVITIQGDIDKIFMVDTEGGAPNDQLDNILGGRDGQVATFRQEVDARDVIYRENVGNLRLEGDFIGTSAEDTITLQWSDSMGIWRELARSNNA